MLRSNSGVVSLVNMEIVMNFETVKFIGTHIDL